MTKEKNVFQHIWDFLISTKLMGFLMLVFGLAIGAATFIENDFGTPASKAVVYNAKWFELVILFLLINFIGNMFRYNMADRKKWPVITFHLSFIFMIIGGGVTRYVSEEGILHIREGKTNNAVVSDKTYFRFRVDDRKMQYALEKNLFLNPLYNAGFSNSFDFNGVPIEVSYKDYLQNAVDTVISDPNGAEYLELVTTDGQGRKTVYLKDGTITQMGFIQVGYNTDVAGLKIYKENNRLKFIAPFEVQYLRMADRSQGVLSADTVHEFAPRQLYQMQGVSIVFKKSHDKVVKSVTTVKGANDAAGSDVLVVDLNVNGEHEDVFIKGGKGLVKAPIEFQRAGLNFSFSYGSKYIYLPFYMQLRDFQLDRYPGSNSPASFASEVTLIDEEQGLNEEHRIYMNHVLDHRGYRLFQSSYDKDEEGTVLSVNRDFWGTWLNYIGYILLGIGMFFTLFIGDSRFGKLGKQLDKVRAKKALLPLLLAVFVNASGVAQQPVAIPVEQAELFGALQVQDQGGRLKPMNTLTSEVLRKVSRKSKLYGLTADQVFLGMMYDAHTWQGTQMIKVSHNGVKDIIGLAHDEKLATFRQFFDSTTFAYLLTEAVETANRKKPAERSKMEDELLKVDERVNICYMVYTGSMLRLFPLPGDENNTWFAPQDANKGFTGNDSLVVSSIFELYFNYVQQAMESGNWNDASQTLRSIGAFQLKYGAEVAMSETKLNAELFYNKYQLFNNLFYYYFTVGLLFLIVLFVLLFKHIPALEKVSEVLYVLTVIGFITHIGALALRWYISGHAPWSNGYESMVYIAFATMLSGFIFGRKSKITLAATTLLTSFILMVAHLNWLDPEVTNLVPVLNSYWLMIHVAIITASYGFIALGCILGFINLILVITAPRDNQKIKLTFKELTIINEMTLQIGLFMLTIGTFLGGVWANESWGRYWGWDAKETWALASVVFYSFVAHMRLIPGLKGGLAFNAAAVIAFSSIIMTYFGVNYYLSGLHSYAAGDPLPVPMFVYYTVAVVFVVVVAAKMRWNSFHIKND